MSKAAIKLHRVSLNMVSIGSGIVELPEDTKQLPDPVLTSLSSADIRRRAIL